MPVQDVATKQDFNQAVMSGTAVVHFWASWCEPCAHMDRVITELAKMFPDTSFYRVEAEEVPDVSEATGVEAVPYFVMYKAGKQVASLEGADPPALTQLVQQHFGGPDTANLAVRQTPTPADAGAATAARSDAAGGGGVGKLPDNVMDRIKALLAGKDVLVFMKGTPEQPKCGFSQRVVDALQDARVTFSHYDILQDEDLRQELKVFSDWPTYPQVYVKGELLGGCDIITQLAASKQLVSQIHDLLQTAAPLVNGSQPEQHQQQARNIRQEIENVLKAHRLVLFMKGTPEAPQCKFSRRVVDILAGAGIKYKDVNILQDQDLREAVKQYSAWPTYPQLFADGELLGGCDIIEQMAADGTLASELEPFTNGQGEKSSPAPLEQRLSELANKHPVMIFMKGVPAEPRCGFSSRVVEALREAGVTFGSFDILGDDEVRQGLKKWAQWPTYPQVYVKGELLGGHDIIMEMRDTGELKKACTVEQ